MSSVPLSVKEKTGIVIIVCGGRAYTDQAKLYETLDLIHSTQVINTLVQGENKGCYMAGVYKKGADQLAREWARERKVMLIGFEADWDTYGPSAGPRRNAEMVKYPGVSLCVVFNGGKGTRDMMMKAIDAKLTLVIVKPENATAA